MKNGYTGRKKNSKEKNLKIHRPGILFLEGISPNIGVSGITVFLKRFGDIKRIFFFNSSRSFSIVHKKGSKFISGIIEFTKKMDAKRIPLIIKSTNYKSCMKAPFNKAFYLKQTNWKKLVEILK
jgi:hypothetical protein